MRKLIHAKLLFSFLLSATISQGQSINLENYLNTSEEIEGSSDLYDMIEEYLTYKFDLNESAVEELYMNQLINSNTIQAIQKRREKGKKFRSVNDVRELNLDEEQENILLSIAGVNIKRQSVDKFKFRSRIIRKTSVEDYPDNPYKIYTRGNLDFSDGLQIGVLTERDVGEKKFDDHLSFYLASKSKNGRYDKIIGDYSIEAGQGLVLWQNGFFGRIGDPIFSIKRNARGIRPYRSALETDYMRGAAGSWSHGNIDFIAFVSLNKLDASLSDSGEVLNFRNSGLHRTEGELSGKDVVQEKIIGINTEWSSSDIKIGSRFATVSYNANVNPFDSSEKLNDFEGREYKTFSVDYDYSINEMNLYGEIAETDGGKKAQIHGLRIGYEQINLGILYRDYDDGYSSVRGIPFGASDNERGVYTGMKWNINRSTSISGFKDLYRKKWVTSNSITPGRSEDFRLEIKRRFSKIHSVRIRIWGATRNINKKIKDEYAIERELLITQRRRNLRIQGKHALSRSIILGWRFERVSKKDLIADENGLLLSVNAKIEATKSLRLYLAATRFKTDSYSSRIYLYEQDLPGILRNSAVFNDGNRFMVLARKEFSSYFSLSIKLEHLSRDNGIEDSVENKIGVQFDLSN